MTEPLPATVNRTLPRRLPNTAYRVREYLTEKEVDRLIEVHASVEGMAQEMQRRSYWRTDMD